MPWTYTQEGTLPSLKNKSLKIRQIFAEVANAALAKGMNEDEAITAGLAAIAAHERKITNDVKKSKVNVTKKANSVPLHLKLIQEAKALRDQQAIEKAQQEELLFKKKVQEIIPEQPTISIREMHFDKQGKLVIKMQDGTQVKTSNSISQEVINQWISINNAGGGTGDTEPSRTIEPVTVIDDTNEPVIVFNEDGDIVMQDVVL